MNTEQTEQIQANISYLVSQGFSETIVQRFWTKVRKTDGCWIWEASHNGHGHGQLLGGPGKPRAYAHVVSWILHNGPIPDGKCVCHSCPGGDNPACVNPAHLFIGTHKQNLQDAGKKGMMHGGFKLTDEQVLSIIRLRPTTSGKELSKRFGISMVMISQIVHGHSYKHLRSLHPDLPPIPRDQRKNRENYSSI